MRRRIGLVAVLFASAAASATQAIWPAESAAAPAETSAGCDWSVQLSWTGAADVDGRWTYEAVVQNDGDATCPADTLKVTPFPGKDLQAGHDNLFLSPLSFDPSLGDPLGYADHPLDAEIPSLSPGDSVVVDVEGSYSSTGAGPFTGGTLTVTATMPTDDDGGADETDTVTTAVVREWDQRQITVHSDGTATGHFDCGAQPGEICRVTGVLDTGPCTASPGSPCEGQGFPCTVDTTDCTPCTDGTVVCTPCTSNTAHCGAPADSAGAQAGRKAKVEVLGRVSGSVKGGERGDITIELNALGLKLLHSEHHLRARLTLEIKSEAGTAGTAASVGRITGPPSGGGSYTEAIV